MIKIKIKRGENILNKRFSKDTLLMGLLLAMLSLFLFFYLTNFYKSEELLTKQEVEWLKSQETLIYGSDKNSPPLRYLEVSDGQYKGVLIDYINALSVELGVSIELHPMIWEDALKNLSQGNSNLCDMFISEER